MWRSATINAKVDTICQRESRLEKLASLKELIKTKKAKRFVTEAADYIVIDSLRYCIKDSYFFNLDRDDARINCGRIKSLSLKQFVRIQGLINGILELEKLIINSVDDKESIDINLFAKVISKAWFIFHDNDEYISTIGYHETQFIADILETIAFCLAKGIINSGEFNNVLLFKHIIEDTDVLTLFISMLSVSESCSIHFNFRNDEGRKSCIHLLSNISFVDAEGENLREIYGDVLKDISSIISTFKISDSSIVFIPNDKYFFGLSNKHRDSCFSTINVINKLIHRTIANMIKFEDEHIK